MSDYDVAIVGASIAGCTAATLLGRQGARVALVESHSDPASYKRMCTHVIQASASPTIRRLGLLEELERVGVRESGVSIWSRYGWVCPSRAYMDEIDEEGVGLNVRRQTLDPMLREMAAETDGVDLVMGETATRLLRRGRRVSGIVTRPRDGAEREIRAKLVVGADGRNSGIAKLAGARAKKKRNNRFVYMGYYRDTALLTGSFPQMWFLDPDMAYAFPTDGGLTLLACVPHRKRLDEFKADPEGAMARTFEGSPTGPCSTRPSARARSSARSTCPTNGGGPPVRSSPWSAMPRSPPTRSGASAAAGPSRAASGWPRRSGRRWAARRRSTSRSAATRTGTAARWHCTTASAPPTRPGAASIRPKG